jgi:hypothetical protein
MHPHLIPLKQMKMGRVKKEMEEDDEEKALMFQRISFIDQNKDCPCRYYRLAKHLQIHR